MKYKCKPLFVNDFFFTIFVSFINLKLFGFFCQQAMGCFMCKSNRIDGTGEDYDSEERRKELEGTFFH